MGLCPYLCLRLSVTSRCSTKTAKRRITQTTPHDTSGTLVFRRQRSPRNSTGVTPLRGRRMQVGWVKVKIGDFRQISGYISKTVKDRHIVSIEVEYRFRDIDGYLLRVANFDRLTEIAGLDNDGRLRRVGHCRSGQ